MLILLCTISFLNTVYAEGPGGGSASSFRPQVGIITPPQPTAFRSQRALLESCGSDDLTNAAANDPRAGEKFGKCNFNRNLKAFVQSAADLIQEFGSAIHSGFTEVTQVSCNKPFENIETQPTDCSAYRESE